MNDKFKPPKEFRICGNCGTEATDFVRRDKRGLEGIAIVLAAPCPNCGHTVWAVSGDKAARQAVIVHLASGVGQRMLAKKH